LTWCDKLASTPSIGLRLDPHLTTTAALLSAIEPVLNEWVDGDTMNFAIDRLDAFGLELTSNNGFHYGIDQSRIWIDFVHRMKLKATSAGPPIAELTSEALPFTRLIDDIESRLVKVTMLLPGVGRRRLRRIGIVATTILDDDAMPPGIARLVGYMARPWWGAVEHYQVQIMSKLEEHVGWIDKCLHILAKPSEPDQLTTLKFDWQRWFDPDQAVHSETLGDLLRKAVRSAMEYFEELAEGNRFDEDILRATA
jgi:hypothetical protein